MFPRIWQVCPRKHNYITAADFVRGRFGSRWLALAVAVTGIIATMPYIALQLVGLQVVIGGLGLSGSGWASYLPLIIAFAILAAFTRTSGLRAPASIAVVKDTLIYITTVAAIIMIQSKLGGFGKRFRRQYRRRFSRHHMHTAPKRYSAYAHARVDCVSSAFLLYSTLADRHRGQPAPAGVALRSAALLPELFVDLRTAGA